MKAVVIEEFGEPEVLKPAEVERPRLGFGGILVRAAAAGINPVDVKTRAGAVGEWFGTPPLVLGWDVSGVVEEVAPGPRSFEAGDEVLGLVHFPALGGAYAEYVAVPAHQLARKPAELDHAAAAGLPLAGLTAEQSLDLAGVDAGQRVLIHAAAGGVGHLAVQLAKDRGATVLGTARAAKHDFLRGLGADELVDYTQQPFEEAVRDVDVVIDTIGGEYGHRSLRTLKRGGTLVALIGRVEDDVVDGARDAGVRVVNHLVYPDGERLARLVELVERGALRVEIERAFPLERAAEAHTLSESGRARGKIVLTIRS
jgi:NADPH:quinone reductase-like Zn-dependent oxidoreductase